MVGDRVEVQCLRECIRGLQVGETDIEHVNALFASLTEAAAGSIGIVSMKERLQKQYEALQKYLMALNGLRGEIIKAEAGEATVHVLFEGSSVNQPILRTKLSRVPRRAEKVPKEGFLTKND